MADPFAIVSLASNIVHFVELGLKLVSGARTIRNSTHGVAPEIEELEVIVADVRRLDININGTKSVDQSLSPEERHILRMAGECDRLVNEICSVTEKLMIRTHARSKTWESGRAAFRGLWKQGDLESLRSRLESMDQRIRSNIMFALEESHHEIGINYEFKLGHIQKEVLRLARPRNNLDDPSNEIRVAELFSLKSKLNSLRKEHAVCVTQSHVLKSLHFQELRRRWSQIPDSHENTNAWLFDRTKTSFVDWLRSGKSQYWISGKAGSGKSTLMKFASEHNETYEALAQWAKPAKVHIASYYFWNQGFEMQKSQLGLFQSLLYQILRLSPKLIPEVCSDRQDYETWDIRALKETFRNIAMQTKIDTKFCFFIDGLDEYAGKEEEVVQMLEFISSSPNIKICTSSRPRYIFKNFFIDEHYTLVIHDHTKDDMKRYIRERLYENNKFQSLNASDPFSEEIVKLLSNRAQGVWLWAFLVTRDLLHAVNRNEGLPMLLKIVHQFPPDLKGYFERIIEGIQPAYREEMAQIFLATVDEVQPLPLFAFSLLEMERVDPTYALKAEISPLSDASLSETYRDWTSRIENRCGDLLVVDNQPHPIFLSHTVDFLHRTVRDFLLDPEQNENLQHELKGEFNSMVSLCRTTLYLLKSVIVADFRDSSCISKVIGLTDEILYYAREAEIREEESLLPPVIEILDQLDKINRYYARSLRNHWSHARDSPSNVGFDEYREGGNCNFLAVTIQARLVKYVRAKLTADPRVMNKSGRPLLDYALRPRRSTPISMEYHSKRDDPSVEVQMVQLLLENGADPNQKVHLYEGRTVWTLFLLSCYELKRRESVPEFLEKAWYRASELLINHGARYVSTLVPGQKPVQLFDLLKEIFGEAKGVRLHKLIEESEVMAAGSSCIVS